MGSLSPRVLHRLRQQYGVISRSQAIDDGMSSTQVQRAIKSHLLEQVHPGVYRVGGAPATPEGDLLAACLTGGHRAVASHESAAWNWGLMVHPPARPTVSVVRSSANQRSNVVVHRSRDLDAGQISVWRGIPSTRPLRTLVDLAAVAEASKLDDAIDRALARRLVTVEGLSAEMARLARPGRSGVGVLRDRLSRRGYVNPLNPSVLESRTLRLLARGGIKPCGFEVKVDGGRYRLDITLSDCLAMEVDGYAYHASPESMRRDLRRRRELARLGWTVLPFTWMDITQDGPRVLKEVHRALQETRRGR